MQFGKASTWLETSSFKRNGHITFAESSMSEYYLKIRWKERGEEKDDG